MKFVFFKRYLFVIWMFLAAIAVAEKAHAQSVNDLLYSIQYAQPQGLVDATARAIATYPSAAGNFLAAAQNAGLPLGPVSQQDINSLSSYGYARNIGGIYNVLGRLVAAGNPQGTAAALGAEPASSGASAYILPAIAGVGVLAAVGITQLVGSSDSDDDGASGGPSGPEVPAPETEDGDRAGAFTFSRALADATLTDAEFLGSHSLTRRSYSGLESPAVAIQAHIAHGYGLTGKGQTIGVIDTSILYNGPTNTAQTFIDLQAAPGNPAKIAIADSSSDGRGNALRTWRCTAISPDGSDECDPHGTAVVSLLAGSRGTGSIQGIAHEANVLFASYRSSLPEVFNEFTTKNLKLSNNSWIGNAIANAEGSMVTPGFKAAYLTEVSPPKLDGTPGDPRYEIDVAGLNRLKAAEGLSNLEAYTRYLGGAQSYWAQTFAAMESFQQGGGIIVFANSNRGFALKKADGSGGLSGANAWTALPHFFPNLQDAWITVANVSKAAAVKAQINGISRNAAQYDTALATYGRSVEENGYGLVSANCGVTAAYCVSADGLSLLSADVLSTSSSNSLYDLISGTSIATPIVSGAVALLQEAFPTQTPQQITTRIFYTANNWGFQTDGVATLAGGLTHAYSNVWGHGIINLERALKPIGPVTTISARGATVSLDGLDTSVVASSNGGLTLALQSALAGANFKSEDVLGARFGQRLDQYIISDGRNFVGDQVQLWQSKRRTNNFAVLDQLDLRFSSRENLVLASPQKTQNEWTLNWRANDQETLAVSTGNTIDQILGFRSTENGGKTRAVNPAFNNPMLGLASENSQWSAYKHSGEQEGYAFGVFSSQDAGHRSTGYLASTDLHDDETQTELQLSAGQVVESGGLLGSKTSGAFASDFASSVFARAAFRTALSDQWALQGSYVLGQTRAKASSQSFLSNYSSIITDSFALGIEGKDLWQEGDLFALTLAQPTRILSGQADVSLPTAYQADGTLAFTDSTLNLAPDARELRFAADQSFVLDADAELKFGGALTTNSGHQGGAPTHFGLSSAFSVNF